MVQKCLQQLSDLMKNSLYSKAYPSHFVGPMKDIAHKHPCLFKNLSTFSYFF